MDPPSDDKFAEFDYYTVPPSDTTYHCKIFKASTHFSTKRHAIAREILVDKNNRDLVHHMLMFECDPSIVSDDNDLSNDLCDNLLQQLQPCFANSATGWVVGDRRDSSGIRYYISDKLRRYDLGYLTFGTGFSIDSIVIPPKMNKFVVNSYCPSQATRV
ncbi:unnamed protein product [Rotaria sp. Silwood1]|nr:unnamed protein product [Rotaria sp. Silwood1]